MTNRKDYFMSMWCDKCNAYQATIEALTQLEDSSILPYEICSKCGAFHKWVKKERSSLVQKILRENLEKYRREKNKISEI